MNKTKKNNIVKFPNNLSEAEREIEAIIFSAAEPLDLETIETKVSKKVIKACEKYGKSCGTQLNDPNLKNIDALFELGYTFAILGSDLFILWKWAEAMKEVMTNFKKNAN